MADESIPSYKGARNDLSAEYVRSVLDYDPETGILRWKVAGKGRPNKIGDIAGSITKSQHIRLGIAGNLYLAHRVAWLIMTGEWPPYEIDHEDTNGLNNSWKNLRKATTAENQRNRPAIKNSSTGYKGVSFRQRLGKYEARIRSKEHGGLIYLGIYTTAEEAHAAYCVAAEKFHGSFMRVE